MGSALEKLSTESPGGFESLKEAAGQNPFLTYVLTNIEASIMSADTNIMREYSELVPDTELRERFLDLILTGI